MPTCGNLLWCGVYTRLGCWVILTKNDEFAQVRYLTHLSPALEWVNDQSTPLYGGWLQVPVSLPRTLAVCRGSRLKGFVKENRP
ncbi:unnamed protein product [Fusarium fujikuroi]|nr:unnamed protein product [Fusarium fujikuroi]